jgi:hypothetical protein
VLKGGLMKINSPKNENVVILARKFIGENNTQLSAVTEDLLLSESGHFFLMDADGEIIQSLSPNEVIKWGLDADSLKLNNMPTLFKRSAGRN